MKAIGINEFGPVDNLQVFDIDRESLQPSDLRIEVKAVSVNPFDTKLRQGLVRGYPNKSRPLILGLDMAGIITEVGEAVTKFKVGDIVIGRPNAKQAGTYRQEIVLAEDQTVEIPQTILPEAAVGLVTAGSTAYQALFEHGQLQAGQKVLIHGGTGGVGHLAIQLAKLRGAIVYTTASPHNHEFLRDLGADITIDYHAIDFRVSAKNMDLVIDTIGGETQRRSLDVLSPQGRLISLVENTDPSNDKILYKSMKVTTEALSEMLVLMKRDQLKVELSLILDFTLENMKRAHRELETKHTRGKIVLTL